MQAPRGRVGDERRPPLSTAERVWIGRRAQTARQKDRHAARRLAEAYGISPSWVRTQRRRAEKALAPRGPGRPRISGCERARVRVLVRAQLDRQGWRTGHRPILEALRREEKDLSETLVREAT